MTLEPQPPTAQNERDALGTKDSSLWGSGVTLG